VTVAILLFILATAGVAAGALGTARLLRLEQPLELLTGWLLLGWVQVLLTSLVVGALLERYERWTLVAATAGWDAAVAAALVAAGRPLAVADAVRGVARAARAAVDELARWQAALAVCAAAALAWRLFLAAVLPPFAYDALAYHLTAVADWVQSGRIGTNAYALCCTRYPSNAEVLFGWPTLLLGRDTLTDAVQVVAAVLGAVAVAGIARAAGARRCGAVTAGALFVLTPVVLTQANTDYNDLTIAAMFLAALFFVARLLATPGRPRLHYALLVGAAAGFAFGSKPNGIGLALAVAVPLLVALAAAARRRRDASRWLAALALFAGTTVVVGGWWYMRNWVETGNPVAPFRVTLLGHRLFRGSTTVHDYLTIPPGGSHGALRDVGRSWYQDLVFWRRSDYSYEERSGGLGPLWSWLGWWVLVGTAALALRRRRDLAVAVLLPAALAFAALPYRWWSRFTLYLPALAAVAIVLVLERLPPGGLRRGFAAAVAALALTGGALASWRLDPAGYGRTLTVGGVLRVAAHPSRAHDVGSLFFSEYAWLARVGDGATIGVEPSMRFVYPLFGSRLERHVVPLSADALRRPPRYLFVQQGGAFDRWARAHRTLYRQLTSGRGTVVFTRRRAAA
jgi:hypothetical protein